ncbi:MAG: hypothetical protein MUP98_16440 [Candidatus Aminicenantes bacterium]|nr:hypothetical protein [Candidatus Aminicenantes bacterium]
MKKGIFFSLVLCLLVSTCQKNQKEDGIMSYKKELQFLKSYVDVIELSDSQGKSKLIAVPAWQGRVMTSSADGDSGLSYGWINHELIASQEIQAHINVFGGEDRFWMGPEGGQFSIFFKGQDPFDLEHWQTPPIIDTEAYDIIELQQDRVVFGRPFHLVNYSGTELEGNIKREIKLLNDEEINDVLESDIPEDTLRVGYVSINTITNSGESPWKKETGLLSVWILGMFTPSPTTTVVIPYIEGEEQELGPIVNDTYFGKVPDSRLKINDGFVFFKGDGLYRSKIGLSPQRSKPIFGSYDASARVLTIVTYTKPENMTDYVNSMWELQEEPFSGDAVNSYNDGPPEPGAKPLGPFYELETSSPAAALGPGESLTHENRTFHFQGTEEDLNKIAFKCLGVGLDTIKAALEMAAEVSVEPEESGWLAVEGADLRGHDIIKADTGENVGMLSNTNSTAKIPPGFYNVTVGQATWKNIEVKAGETTILKPGWLEIKSASFRGHSVLDAETEEEHGQISSLASSLTLMPGDYKVSFGSLFWDIKIEEGKTLTLNPGTVTVDGASYRGHTIKTKDGLNVGYVSNTAATFTLPPGEYTIEVGGKTIPFTLNENQHLTFEEK